MITYPYAKINLGLRIVRRREDGFHDLSSFFVPVPLQDILEIQITEGSGKMTLSTSGLEIPTNGGENILFRCYDAFQEAVGDVPSLECHLHKQIPMGAGLGGGSSDAASFVKLLNKLSGNHLTKDQMKELLLPIGTDCLFFMDQGSGLVEGKGDRYTAAPLDLSGQHMVLIYPGIAISTQEAYGTCAPSGARLSLDLLKDPTSWRGTLVNDFESTLFEKYPTLARVKEMLYTQGAYYASMSGSGSVMFGLFEERPGTFEIQPEWSSWYLEL